MIAKRALILVALLVGCTTNGSVHPTAAPSPPPEPTATATGLPSPVAPPTAKSGTGRLRVIRTDTPPAVDGRVEEAWESADALSLPLYWGFGGTEKALDVALRALRTDDAIFFLARWPGEPPAGEVDTSFNKLTVHWRIPDATERKLDCAVACHTAFVDGEGRFVSDNAETIPPGSSQGLPIAGGWHAGTWTVEWRRPLTNQNYYDLQFDDLGGEYPFFVKLFERIESRPDPVSPLHRLAFVD
jgi:hypothetical protein